MQHLVIVKNKWAGCGPEEILGGVLDGAPLDAEETLRLISEGADDIMVSTLFVTRQTWQTLTGLGGNK